MSWKLEAGGAEVSDLLPEEAGGIDGGAHAGF